MKDKILLTGISGNVGSAVVDYLKSENIDFLAGVRNIEKSKELNTKRPKGWSYGRSIAKEVVNRREFKGEKYELLK